MPLNQDEIEHGKRLAEIMLSRKLSKDEDALFTYAVGYGAGFADARKSGYKKERRKFYKFKPD